MLASFHVPIADLRLFFSDELGKVGPRNASSRQARLGAADHFLRSVGLPQRRWLGPGSEHLNEQSYFSFGRVTRCTIHSSSNLLLGLNVADHRIFKRYYQFDEVAGRFEVAIPIGKRHFAGSPRVSIAMVLQMLRNVELHIQSAAMTGAFRLESPSRHLGQFIQSRTTRERSLKSNAQHRAVFTSLPVLFLELRKGELASLQDVAPIPTTIESVGLYYGYLTRGVPCWVVEHDGTAESKESARLLRMYLSRLYCQQSAFRLLVQRLPRLADLLNKEGNGSALVVDRYTMFLAEHRRFLAALATKVAHGTGAEFARAAGYANDMITATKVTEIIAEHQAIITRGNILRNLAADVQHDADLGQHVKASNININLFGRQRAHQLIAQDVRVPRPTIDIAVVRKCLGDLSGFFAVYGHVVEKGKQDMAHRILVDMQLIARQRTIFGPALARELEKLKQLFAAIDIGRAELSRIAGTLEKALLA